MSSHSSLMMLLSKLAPQSLRSLASALKIEMYPCHRNLATGFAVWSGVTYAITCLVKWSQEDQNIHYMWWLVHFHSCSMPVKSTWSSSKGEVTRIACSGALAWAPSCWIHLSQLLITFCICIAMPGHQNWSCNRDSVCPLALMSCILWHPFMATTLWAVGTTNCIASSSALASWSMAVVEGILMEHEFLPFPKDGHTLFHHGVVPQEMFKILYFMGGNPLHHNFEYGIFLLCSYPVCYMQVYMHMWAACAWTAVSSTCIMYPFIGLSHQLGHGHQPFLWSLWWPHPGWNFTASAFSFDATWLRASATALSLPFWYSMLNVNPASESTQWCWVASKLGVVRI